jgi:leucyl-tRNA synthetase
VVAEENTKNFKRQVQMFGLSYDWDREINTSLPEYYKWTQWLFIQLYKKQLAYQAEAKVNWCSKDQTVLANEQVIDGKCERCGSEVEERDMLQWFLRITQYANHLLDDMKDLDWPGPTWIIAMCFCTAILVHAKSISFRGSGTNSRDAA